ncbi:MAG: glycosyltransferase family 9 protein [Candidatus Kapaibacteriales bacterium]
MKNKLRIAILRLGTIGDLILSTPMFSYIKKKYPNSYLTLIVGKRNKDILSSNPYVDEIIEWNKSPFHLPKAIWTIKKKYFNFYIDPKDHFSRESLIICKIVRAETKIGYNLEGKLIFNVSIPSHQKNQGLHYTQIIFNSLFPLNISLKNSDFIPKPQLFINHESKVYVESFLKQIKCNGKFIIINISASNIKKMLPIDRLIDGLKNSHFENLKICKILTFTKNHTKLASKILETFPQIIPFRSRRFNDIVALVYESKGVITPDTSIVHICSAFEKPLLAFYSGLDEFFTRFRPVNPNAITIRAEKGDEGLQTISSQQITSSINLFMADLTEII